MAKSTCPLLSGGKTRSPRVERDQKSGHPKASSSCKPPGQKRTNSVAACKQCRNRKTKCSGDRPQCKCCVTKGTPCHYTTLPDESHIGAQKRTIFSLQCKVDKLEGLFGRMQTWPEAEVIGIVLMMRSCKDLESVVQNVQGAELLLHLSGRAALH